MNIESKITVGNCTTLGFDSVKIETGCYGFVSIFIPMKDGVMEIELHRRQLREFLARTCPEFAVTEAYKAEIPEGKP